MLTVGVDDVIDEEDQDTYEKDSGKAGKKNESMGIGGLNKPTGNTTDTDVFRVWQARLKTNHLP